MTTPNLPCPVPLSPQPPQESEAVRALVAALDVLCGWVDDIPPAAQSLRYGNPAFRTWFARLEQNAQRVRGTVCGVCTQTHAEEQGAAAQASLLLPP